MHRTLALITSLAALACALGALGCSSSPSSSDSGQGGGCSSATVSFSKDVIPIFQMSCTLGTVCHGQMGNSGELNLYLGMNSGGTSSDFEAVQTGLVGVTSKEDSAMKLVTAGDPANSYLFQKVNNNQAMLNSMLGSACTTTNSMCSNCTSAFGPCGAPMPYTGEQLAQDKICTIQNWIQQGAQNN